MKRIVMMGMLLAFSYVTVDAGGFNKNAVEERKQREVNMGWKDFEGRVLRLLMYGQRENGRAINKFFPSKENGNEHEAIIYKKGGMLWAGGQVGDETFTYEIKGKYLYLKKASTGENWGWILLEGVVQNIPDGSYELFTINNVNWYRWFFVDPF